MVLKVKKRGAMPSSATNVRPPKMASELALLGRVTGMLSGQSMNLYVERHSVAAHQRQLSSGGE